MKVRTHLRVSYDKKRRATTVATSQKPNNTPLTNSRGEYLPTVSFGIDLEIPDAMFTRAEQIIATLVIPEESAQIAAEVRPR